MENIWTQIPVSETSCSLCAGCCMVIRSRSCPAECLTAWPLWSCCKYEPQRAFAWTDVYTKESQVSTRSSFFSLLDWNRRVSAQFLPSQMLGLWEVVEFIMLMLFHVHQVAECQQDPLHQSVGVQRSGELGSAVAVWQQNPESGERHLQLAAQHPDPVRESTHTHTILGSCSTPFSLDLTDVLPPVISHQPPGPEPLRVWL